ncbi:tagaturonate reductase [Paenibacillus sp. CAU 1782]
MTIDRLNAELLGESGKERLEALRSDPVTVLQIGEGNFLRGFVDLMLYESRKKGVYNGSVAVVQPRPGGRPKIEALAEQDGLYTVVVRGLQDGKPVERKEIVEVFGRVFDPYSNWETFLEIAKGPELQIVVSNTTEAGIAYRPEVLVEGQPAVSYPGKLAQLLYHRYLVFDGDGAKGLYFFPCELLERNGDALKECVLQYCKDWDLPEAFIKWVLEHNRFLNSLVDRIVTGYPDEAQAEAWFQEWGYRDPMLTTAEPYHLWVIEGEPELEDVLPLARSGMNVRWVEELNPYQQRKVRILNGAHTLMALVGLVHGLKEVRETMEHSRWGALVKRTVEEEIIPSLPYDRQELESYAAEVTGRFLNPFIRHRLSDIAMNSLSKFKTRLLPSISHYWESAVPVGLLHGLAGLLRYYKIANGEDGYEGYDLAGERYIVKDDAALLEIIADIWATAKEQNHSLQETVQRLLALEQLWGLDLNAVAPGLAEAAANLMEQWEDGDHEQRN